MGKTLTIRLPDSQDRALTKKASALGRTRSDLVREMIEHGLEKHALGRRIGHVKGRVSLGKAKGGWRRQIKERNWR